MPRRYVTTPTFGDIAYAAAGAGPTALFVHGVFLNADLWRHQVGALSDLRHCIAIDLLAHGESPCPPGHLTIGVQAAMVLEFLDALGVDAVDIVGNDTGGAVVQMIAASQPSRLRSLTLTNCDVHDNFPPKAFLPIHELAGIGLLVDGMAVLAHDPAGIRAALESTLEDPEAVPDQTLLNFFGVFAAADKAAAVQDYIAGMEPSQTVAIRDDLARFSAPTLIVWATDDVFFAVEWAEWLEATIPGVTRSVRVEDARLFFPLERPDALNGELRQFWSDPDPSLSEAEDVGGSVSAVQAEGRS
jgi:pimeloyl-ACP methyl ester carboxylesterase